MGDCTHRMQIFAKVDCGGGQACPGVRNGLAGAPGELRTTAPGPRPTESPANRPRTIMTTMVLPTLSSMPSARTRRFPVCRPEPMPAVRFPSAKGPRRWPMVMSHGPSRRRRSRRHRPVDHGRAHRQRLLHDFVRATGRKAEGVCASHGGAIVISARDCQGGGLWKTGGRLAPPKASPKQRTGPVRQPSPTC